MRSLLIIGIFLCALSHAKPFGPGQGAPRNGAFGPGGSGSGTSLTLNGLTDSVQSFATGTSGTDFAISSGASTHTFNLPDASASARGVVSTGSQTFAGAKTFSSNPVFSLLTASTVPYLDAGKALASSSVTPTELGYLSGVTSAVQTQLNAKQASGNYITALTGDVSASGPGSASSTISASTVTGKALTGFSSTTGTVTSADTVLSAFNKLYGNQLLKAPLASPSFTGTIGTPLTASRVVTTDASGNLAAATVTTTTLGYLDATSSIQTQLNAKEGTITTLSVAKGGTNSGTALNNNRVMKSSSGSIVEAAAITASRALISDANGIPTHSTTTSTELGYVSGVTSAIQTQIDALKVEQLDGMVESPSNKTYIARLKTKYAGTINEVSFKTASGTITAKLQIDGVDVTSCTAISVTSTASTTTCTAANTFTSAQTLTVVTSSNSSAADLQWSIKVTR